MILFYFTGRLGVSLDYRGSDRRLRLPAVHVTERDAELDGWNFADLRTTHFEFQKLSPGPLSSERLYVATPLELEVLAAALQDAGTKAQLRVLSGRDTEQVLRRKGFPVRLGKARASGPFHRLERQASRLSGVPKLRIAILNVFSYAYGDSILFLTALRELRERLLRLFPTVELELLQARFSTETDSIYLRSGLVSRTRMLPLALSDFVRYDAYVDLSTEHLPSDRPWIDACLESMGVSAAEVRPERKRNRVVPDSEISTSLRREIERLRSRGPITLFHPLASTPIRSMPASLVREIVLGLSPRIRGTLVTAIELPFSNGKLVNWGRFSKTFESFVHIVASVDAFISVDTVTYHIADAFDVPGVVLFTSIDPDTRIRYYPYVNGLDLSPGNRLRGTHYSDKPNDIVCAQELWSCFNARAVIDKLPAAVRRQDTAAALLQ